ncbi:MAG: glycerophosphodiester phosphodiesterase [Gemmatimonadota bacterium]|nr:glycerophosphodiester phosphodiesterase [Gemmatimonadota bacterium]
MVLRSRPRPGRAYLAGAPLLVAHRGGSRLAPENTMAAFYSAVRDWGADMLELDVRLSKDGVVMVIHDDSVDRTTNGAGPVSAYTSRELKKLDAGYRFRDLDGDFSFRGKGVTIPTLNELLEALPAVWLNIEAKEASVAGPLVEVIRNHGAEYRVLVAAEHEKNRIDARGYKGPWGASTRDCILFWILHRLPGGAGFTPKADVFQVPESWHGFRVLTPRLVAEAHKMNIPVHVWTVDDQDDMRRLLSWGVDAIQTDRPDILSQVLVSKAGRPLPPVLRRKSVEAFL